MREERIISQYLANQFNAIRIDGNRAVHGKASFSAEDGQTAVRRATTLAASCKGFFEVAAAPQDCISPQRAPAAKATLGGAADYYVETAAFADRYAAYARATHPSDRAAAPSNPSKAAARSDGSRRSWKVTLLLLAITLALGLLSQMRRGDLAIWASRSTTFEQPRTYRIIGSDSEHLIEARSGPGLEYPVVADIAEGAELSCIARSVDANGTAWIQFSNGGGWIEERLLTEDSSPP